MTSKLPNTGTTIFTIMSKMAAKYGAINLSQGFPDFDCDPALIALVTDAMEAGHNQYAPMPGDWDLRSMISNKIYALYEQNYDPETEITITAGATQAIFTAVAAVIHPGEEVIVFAPAYDCYEPTIELFGAKSIPIQLEPPLYSPDWVEVEAVITPKTRMIIINSPHNPSGMVFGQDDLKQLERIVLKHDLLVVSDEVYEHIIFDGRVHQSVARYPNLAARSFITASFGKTFHNTGWKLGYCVAPGPWMNEFRKVHQYNVFSVNHPIQRALAIYLQDPEHYLGLAKFFEQKRDFFLSFLKGSRFQFEPSQGTYFQLLDYSAITNEADTVFTERLTKENGVATIPTSVFNKDHRDFKQIRVCFAKKEETLAKAAKLLANL
ncbi:MAG: methionine aminotransferase [Bacteroidia bacterium]|nr:methionine aminotransferase [Bacteroidia bacterium]NNM23215.1 methionine aminotransferase [Flavobacteriaceae bacterium]